MKSLNLKLFTKSAQIAVMAALAIVCFATRAEAQAITVGQLAGIWKIAIVGDTGCGQTSMQFFGTLNVSGTGTGSLTSASGCGTNTSTQTFTITSLNAQGTGTANLSCGSGCGWNFDIQVAPNRQTFNLVDVTNGGANVLAGTAVAEQGSVWPISVAQLAGPWKIAIAGNTGCGQTSMLFSGTLNGSGTATGTLTSASGCGQSSSTQTFTINSLNGEGNGTATLSCGSGCGWTFDIAVALPGPTNGAAESLPPIEQTFSLVDVANGGSNVLAGTAVRVPESAAPITVAQLAGPWQIAIVGNTGCGKSSMLFTGTLNSSGRSTGTLTGASRCGTSSSTQTFTITSLNAQGAGTANLSCGSGCGWNFNIQVAANEETFNLADVTNGGANVLAGTAVAANQIIIGLPPKLQTGGGSLGSNYLGRYQQVYSSSLFNGPVTITALKFYNTQINSGATIMPTGTTTVSLSTTSADWNTLSTDFAANVGPNNTMVFDGNLAQAWAFDDTLTITLSTPFTYVPANGNLLMDVTISSVTQSNTVGVLFDIVGGDVPYGSFPVGYVVTGATGVNVAISGTGLVTAFSY